MASLVAVVRKWAEVDPEFRVFDFLSDLDAIEASATYAELDRAARRVAAYLTTLEARGERVLLLFPPGQRYVEAFLGCLYAGAIAVPAYPPTNEGSMSRIRSITIDSGARFALTTDSVFERKELLAQMAPELAAVHWVVIEQIPAGSENFWEDPELPGEALAFLQYTSGSTGTPKGVMVSHENLFDNLLRINERLGLTRADRAFTWLPPYHDMGLIGGILQGIYAGYHTFIASPMWFSRRPERWLQRIATERITVSGAPNFAFNLCVERHRKLGNTAPMDLSCWRMAYMGAEPVRAATLREFMDCFGPLGFRESALCPLYGMAEATLMISGDGPGDPIKTTQVDKERYAEGVVEAADDKRAMELVGCGAVVSGHQLVIVDPERCVRAAQGRVGEIWFAGPSVTRGYWGGHPERVNFEGQLRDAGPDDFPGPYLRTGDLGFVRDGQLFIAGRIKDTIVVRGRKHHPQDLEQTAQACHPRLLYGRGAAFAIDFEGSEQVVLAQEVAPGEFSPAEVGQAVDRAVSLSHGIYVHTVCFLKNRTLPKTSSGKVCRAETRQAFLAERLQLAGTWTNPRNAGQGARVG